VNTIYSLAGISKGRGQKEKHKIPVKLKENEKCQPPYQHYKGKLNDHSPEIRKIPYLKNPYQVFDNIVG